MREAHLRGNGDAASPLPCQLRPPSPHHPQAGAVKGSRDEGDLVD